jgi:hypothetical protein
MAILAAADYFLFYFISMIWRGGGKSHVKWAKRREKGILMWRNKLAGNDKRRMNELINE